MSLIRSIIKVISSALVLGLLCYSSIASARFLSADPMGVGEHVQRYQDGLRRPVPSAWHVPLELNPYAAVVNNPLRWIDRTGRATVAPESGGGPFNQTYYPPDYVGSSPDSLGVLKHMGKTLGAIVGVPALIGTIGATAPIIGEACLTAGQRAVQSETAKGVCMALGICAATARGETLEDIVRDRALIEQLRRASEIVQQHTKTLVK